MGMVAEYGDEHIRTLDWKEHIRRRPGMYIGKLGDGTSADDGIYILIKEVLDNSVDEYMMGFGKSIDITIADDKTVTVRDYGRGVPLGKLVDVASKMNTGAKPAACGSRRGTKSRTCPKAASAKRTGRWCRSMPTKAFSAATTFTWNTWSRWYATTLT